MGLNINGTRLCLYARMLGVDYSQSAMIGRQSFYLSSSELRKTLVELGFLFDEETIDSILNEDDGYAEEFFRCLGANDIHSFDSSSYEGATHIHDMNQDIPDDFKEQYSIVFDGGSLEHIFNLPVALKNCMQMLKVGGHYIGITPANNFMGHGFYQFSPELYFSTFTKENGFELIDIIAFEDEGRTTWFSVKSPISVGSRVTFINSVPVSLIVIAKRVKRCPIFESLPQQSDYVSIWNKSAESLSPVARKRGLVVIIKKYIPRTFKLLVRRLLRRLLRRRSSGFNQPSFQRIQPTDNVPNKTIQRTIINLRR